MDFSKDSGAAAYSENSETDLLGENYSWKIPINHYNFRILKNNESRLCEFLRNKFGCVSTLVSPAQESNSESWQVFRKRLTPGLELSVWKGDLTKHVVDVVVNAANEDLLHGGGLAKALVKAGGEEIQEESRRIVSRCGKIPTGSIATTGAGRLPCVYIIHAVGPRWVEMNRKECMANLELAILNILESVTFSPLCPETVAIPALSSGIFQFPLDLCTRIIVDTIRYYFQRRQITSNLKEIHLVSNEDPTVAAFKTAAEDILGSNELGSEVSQGAVLHKTMVLNNLTLQIVQGHIELQKTDVIVNSVTPSHGIRVGAVSESILQKAGDNMEKEFLLKFNQISRDSHLVLVTKGFELLCQYVFHVLWPVSCSTPDLRLGNAVEKCLEKCLEHNVTSISFPALGTGPINIEKSKAAGIMFDRAVMFAKSHVGKQLTINFVILPKEMETYKAFITAMERAKSKLQPPSNYSVPQGIRENQENGLKAKSPAINLMGSNREKMDEALEWIQQIMTHQDQHIIENNHILYLGKKEHDILSWLQETSRVSITEVISPGKALLEIKGAKANLIEVVMNIEEMLGKVQEEMERKKAQALWSLSGQWTKQPKRQDEMKEKKFLKCLTISTPEILDKKKQFENCGLHVIKVERIDNEVLMAAFLMKKKMMEERMSGKPVSHRLFQQVPQQFREVVCKVGFQRVYSVPCDPVYGAGIYFKRLKSLAYQAKKTSATNKPIYVFEAEVLTGSYCQGHQQDIVPPPLSPGVIDRHDSVVDSVSRPETFVIFSSVQAMPLYLWTCIQGPGSRPQDYSSNPMNRGTFSSGSPVD